MILPIQICYNFAPVKKIILIALITFVSILYTSNNVIAQCSICARTAQQMGEKPAQGLNSGILYLMAAPFLVVGVIGYRWWKSNGKEQA
jgi:hypothetical protein